MRPSQMAHLTMDESGFMRQAASMYAGNRGVSSERQQRLVERLKIHYSLDSPDVLKLSKRVVDELGKNVREELVAINGEDSNLAM